MISGGTSFMFSRMASAICRRGWLVRGFSSTPASCLSQSSRVRPAAVALAVSAATCSSGSSIVNLMNDASLHTTNADTPRNVGGVGVLQKMFLHFAHGVARETVHGTESARDFEGRKCRAAAGLQIRG